MVGLAKQKHTGDDISTSFSIQRELNWAIILILQFSWSASSTTPTVDHVFTTGETHDTGVEMVLYGLLGLLGKSPSFCQHVLDHLVL